MKTAGGILGVAMDNPVIETRLSDSWTAPGQDSETAAEGRPALWLSRLTLTNFRSYELAELALESCPQVFTGPNGAGKTNLLEAVSLLAPGRGLRGARMAELEHRPPQGDGAGTGSDGWAVAAQVVTAEAVRSLGTGRAPTRPEGPGAESGESNGRERRIFKLDAAPAKNQAAFAAVLRLVWLTPQMDGLFRESAGERRRFLDRLVIAYDPDHSGRIQAYEHALRERSRLLKGGFEDLQWLASLEDSMARHGVAIVAARRDMVARLNHAAAAGDAGFPAVALALDCPVDAWLETMAALAAEDELRGRLAESRRQDGEAGGAAIGPHRSDLSATHLGKGMPAQLCSTGEQKVLLTAIVLAHARLLTLDAGRVPLLLLDELAAHLDDEHRAALFAEILALGAQAWITGTDRAVFSDLAGRAQFHEVSASRIVQAVSPGRTPGS